MRHRLVELERHTLLVSDPDRRLCADRRLTKLELLEYYLKIAPRIIPYLRGRPNGVVLFPDDSTQEFRFSPIAPRGLSNRFPKFRRARGVTLDVEQFVAIPDEGTLGALVDYGCLSFHPWNSTAAAALQPTQMVFNLDPEAIAFREVRNAALLLRDLLAVCGLRAWVKTTGGDGLHVLVPVSDRVSFDDMRCVAGTIVNRAIRRDLTLFSRDPRRLRRRGRIFIDISRNGRGGMVIAPYAVATSGRVSTLLEWEELQCPVYPDDFDLDRVIERVERDAKNHASFFAADQFLMPLVSRRRSRQSPMDTRSDIHEDTERLLGNAAATLGDGLTGCASAQNRQLRDEAEVAWLESRFQP